MIDSDIRLDFSPSWWLRHSRAKEPASCKLVARAIACLLGELPGAIHNVQANHRNLHAFFVVPTEARLEFVHAVRDRILGKLEGLERELEEQGELRKPIERLVVENVLWRRVREQLEEGAFAGALEQARQIEAIQHVDGPFTQDVECAGSHRPVHVPPGGQAYLQGQFYGDIGAVVTGFETEGTGNFHEVQVNLLRGMTIMHQTTLHGLVAYRNYTPPLWIPPRQTYRVDLQNQSEVALDLRNFRMHGYFVEYSLRDGITR